jgi:hypothetical protein
MTEAQELLLTKAEESLDAARLLHRVLTTPFLRKLSANSHVCYPSLQASATLWQRVGSK